MNTLVYVHKSTSGAFVGKTYEVNLSRVETLRDGEASFRPTQLTYLDEEKTRLRASDSQFAVECSIVGTIPEPQDQ